MRPGRYAAIDVGTNSVLLLVAEVNGRGDLRPLLERSRITRLGENVAQSGLLSSAAVTRTLKALTEFVGLARETRPECAAIIGTAVLREARNADEFCGLVRSRCGLMVEVITGEQEAELAWRAQMGDPGLAGHPGERAVLDIGGGSTEVVTGTAHEIAARASYKLGAVRITEKYLKHD